MTNKVKCIKIKSESISNYSHARCYAKNTNNCSTKISGEHFISDTILRNLEFNKTVKITGLPWQEKGKFSLLSRNSLQSKILCTKHNEMLSPFDDQMGRFFRTVIQNDKNLLSDTPSSSVTNFCGYDLEKWMLKVTCAFMASNQIETSTEKPCEITDIHLDILFSDKPFPKFWGLYINPQPLLQTFHSIGFAPLIGQGTNALLGAEFLINNVRFYLILGTPGSTSAFGMYHPAGIEMVNGSYRRRIEIFWPGENENNLNGIYLKYSGKKSSTHPPEWPDYLKK